MKGIFRLVCLNEAEALQFLLPPVLAAVLQEHLGKFTPSPTPDWARQKQTPQEETRGKGLSVVETSPPREPPGKTIKD